MKDRPPRRRGRDDSLSDAALVAGLKYWSEAAAVDPDEAITRPGPTGRLLSAVWLRERYRYRLAQRRGLTPEDIPVPPGDRRPARRDIEQKLDAEARREAMEQLANIRRRRRLTEANERAGLRISPAADHWRQHERSLSHFLAGTPAPDRRSACDQSVRTVRPRGAGRPKAHPARRSSSASGDSGDDGPGDPAPSHLTVRAVRADILHRALIAAPDLEVVEDIARLARVARWQPLVRDVAVADLVAEGKITEAADGRLCIHRREVSR